MGKITEYQVASGGPRSDINENVNRLIQEGFQPFGQISITVDEDGVYFAQPMVKYADSKTVGAMVG